MCGYVAKSSAGQVEGVFVVYFLCLSVCVCVGLAVCYVAFSINRHLAHKITSPVTT